MQIPSFMCIGSMVIEFNDKKKKNNMQKRFNLDRRWSFSEIFGTQITFIQSQIDLKLKARSEFPNGESSNPYIQGSYYRTLFVCLYVGVMW